MTAINGFVTYGDTISVSHLGKRKRTASPETAKSEETTTQSLPQDLLQLLRKHDTTPSILSRPIPSSQFDVPDQKRARLVKSDPVSDTIEGRILNGRYDSLRALKEDVKSVHNAMLLESSEPKQTESSESDTQTQLKRLMNVLEQHDSDTSDRHETQYKTIGKEDSATQKSKQFLSLRSNVNGNAHVLFSGLQVDQQIDKIKSETAPTATNPSLPNGFELTDFSALGKSKEDLEKQEKRTFEKVFTTFRRLKPLDLPHSAKDIVRGNTVDFVPEPGRTQQNKHDYKFARLPTGSWLSYRQSRQDRLSLQQASSSMEFKASLVANGVRHATARKEEELFTSVYSSFAPSSDNSYSLVSQEDLSRHWWNRHGEKKLSRFSRLGAQTAVLGTAESDAGNDDFADVVANFEPEEAEEEDKSPSGEQEVEKLLEEVSEMIEALSSYQRNRSLDIIASGKVQKPEQPESDTFEMLRDQLTILISNLPPFAVAKLNGEQLDELNISTRVVVEVPDYAGTGQPDDYQLRRQKMAQQVAQASSRTAATPQPVRPNYSSVQANTMGYNSQVRNYNAPAPASTAYSMRTAQAYNTPTAARTTYSQTPSFQASATTNTAYSANRPTIQQFQRPTMQNGFGSYGGNTASQVSSQIPTAAGAYAPRAAQPGYQQRAQEAAVLARSSSPQKPQPMMNGTSQPHTARPFGLQQGQTQTAQQYAAYPRQGSGTPTTPFAPAALAARSDSAQNGARNVPPAQMGTN